MQDGTIGRFVFATLLVTLGITSPARAVDLSGDTIVVAGASFAEVVASDTLDDAIREALASGGSIRDVSAELAARFGLSRREVYRRALVLRS